MSEDEFMESMIPTAEEKAMNMISWLCEGLSMKEISDTTGLSISTLRRMREGKATDRTWEMLHDLISDCIHSQNYGF